MSVLIPESEMHITFVRSSGPGGQHVNKTNTKAVVRWGVDDSRVLGPEQKARVREQLAGQITRKGELLVAADDTREQSQNRMLAITRLREKVTNALAVPVERVPTKPTRASNKERIEAKRHQARKKRDRQFVSD